VGLDGVIVGIDSFGESAPAGALFKHFGFTVDNVVAAVRRVIQQTDTETQSMRKQP
jgi:transketolase